MDWKPEGPAADRPLLTVDEVRSLVPEELDELRPLVDWLVMASRSDGSRRWSGSGELGTIGERLVDVEHLERAIPEMADRAKDHLLEVLGAVAEGIRAVALGRPDGALVAFVRAACRERDAGRPERADAYIRAAIRLSERARDRSSAIDVFLTGAGVSRLLGDLDTADARYREALGIARDGGRPDLAARAAVGRGNVAVDRGRWSDALGWYDRAEAFLDEVDGPAMERWHIPLNRSIALRRQGDLEGAESALETAADMAGALADPDAVHILLNHRGRMLQARQRHEAVELTFVEALESAATPNARVLIGVHLAESLLAKGRVLDAGHAARTAEETARLAGVVIRLPDVYRVLGQVAHARGHADAFLFFERAFELIRERRLPEMERAAILEAYAEWDRDAGVEEAARARLEEAERIYAALGMDVERERTRALLAETRYDAHDEEQGSR